MYSGSSGMHLTTVHKGRQKFTAWKTAQNTVWLIADLLHMSNEDEFVRG